MIRFERHMILPLVFVALLFVGDQLSKWWVLEHLFRPYLGAGESVGFMQWLAAAPARLPFVSLPLIPSLNLTMVWNEGVSFGLLSSDHTYGPLLLKILALGITAGFTVWMLRTRSNLEQMALALVVGGALGNIFDRARFAAVADFFDVYWQQWHFPVFNVADACITVGVVLLLIHGLFFDKILRKDPA